MQYTGSFTAAFHGAAELIARLAETAQAVRAQKARQGWSAEVLQKADELVQRLTQAIRPGQETVTLTVDFQNAMSGMSFLESIVQALPDLEAAVKGYVDYSITDSSDGFSFYSPAKHPSLLPGGTPDKPADWFSNPVRPDAGPFFQVVSFAGKTYQFTSDQLFELYAAAYRKANGVGADYDIWSDPDDLGLDPMEELPDFEYVISCAEDDLPAPFPPLIRSAAGAWSALNCGTSVEDMALEMAKARGLSSEFVYDYEFDNSFCFMGESAREAADQINQILQDAFEAVFPGCGVRVHERDKQRFYLDEAGNEYFFSRQFRLLQGTSRWFPDGLDWLPFPSVTGGEAYEGCDEDCDE